MKASEAVKAEDLRIGNLVLADSIVAEVLNIDENGINHAYYDGEHNCTYLSAISGIPLNEEWLLKFRFEKIKKEHYGNYDTWELVVSEINFRFRLETSPDRSNYFYATYVPIKHVHRLQNLFHSLTGKEL